MCLTPSICDPVQTIFKAQSARLNCGLEAFEDLIARSLDCRVLAIAGMELRRRGELRKWVRIMFTAWLLVDLVCHCFGLQFSSLGACNVSFTMKNIVMGGSRIARVSPL